MNGVRFLLAVGFIFSSLSLGACQNHAQEADASAQFWERSQLPELLNELERACYSVSEAHIEYLSAVGRGEVSPGLSPGEAPSDVFRVYVETVRKPLVAVLGPNVNVDPIDFRTAEAMLIGASHSLSESGFGVFQHIEPQMFLAYRPETTDYLLEFAEPMEGFERNQAIVDLHFDYEDRLTRIAVKQAGFGIAPSLAPKQE